jgi:hypothetical protein
MANDLSHEEEQLLAAFRSCDAKGKSQILDMAVVAAELSAEYANRQSTDIVSIESLRKPKE